MSSHCHLKSDLVLGFRSFDYEKYLIQTDEDGRVHESVLNPAGPSETLKETYVMTNRVPLCWHVGWKTGETAVGRGLSLGEFYDLH